MTTIKPLARNQVVLDSLNPILFVLELFKDGHSKALGVYGVAVYSVLAYNSNPETGESWMKYQDIADRLNCSRRQVIRAINDLQSGGLIAVTERKLKSGAQTSNLITLQPPSQWLPAETIIARREGQKNEH